MLREAMEAQFVEESDGLTFWLARPQDYDEVMAISQEIYEGNDYLPHRYQTWMTERDRIVIIARRNGKLVALDSALVVDGGQTVVLEGLRVCISERGHGVAGVIQRVTDRYIKQVYPNVTTKRLTRRDNPGPEKLSKFIFLACRAVLSLCVEAESFKRFISGLKTKLECPPESDWHSNNSHKLFVLKDSQQLKTLLLDPDLSSRLQLPGGAIIQDWQPLRPMESNLEILERRNLTWVVDSVKQPMFMSFHTPPYSIPFNGGSLRLNIDMFGTDVTIAKKALVTHFEQVLEEIRGTVLVHVYMPQNFWEAIKQFCDGDNGVKHINGYWEQMFLEEKLP
ncbi:histidine N-acetyltransferase-like [Clarias gariepinus]|uniref:histidine N-acetyltransferase-like n=1 Tax=Clarias gariepinus TaxID=13013 RepID=UPI00234E2366|nr:histidine N-acetyltransferase-like [Clarias gariepinus]